MANLHQASSTMKSVQFWIFVSIFFPAHVCVYEKTQEKGVRRHHPMNSLA